MAVDQNTKIIFGLKVKQLRKQYNLSFQELKDLSGLSVSYLNEIEKGKKYPRQNKIDALAEALRTTSEELVSRQLSKNLMPLADLLDSNFLQEIPLDLFGIEAAKVVEIIANAPTKVGAFISSLVEISRKYELRQQHFYFSALRSYQEMHNNFFEEIEEEVSVFAKDNRLSTSSSISSETLMRLLHRKYKYKIEEDGLSEYEELKSLRSVFIPKRKRLLLNYDLNDSQKGFVLGKELAFNHLKLKNRLYTSTFLKVKSFDQVLNNFKAAYFSNALLINRESLIADLKNFFKLNRWNSMALFAIMDKYQASPEMFLHRLTNLIPEYFGIDDLFFLRFNHTPGAEKYYLTKELHLNRQHRPHGNEVDQHYCRRWVSIWLFDDLMKLQQSNRYIKPVIDVQRSKYIGSEDEYFCITIASPGHPTPDTNISVTIGFYINEKLKETIRFWDDDNIPSRWVNVTCERCPAVDCEQRAVPATYIEHNEKIKSMEETLNTIWEK